MAEHPCTFAHLRAPSGKFGQPSRMHTARAKAQSIGPGSPADTNDGFRPYAIGRIDHPFGTRR